MERQTPPIAAILAVVAVIPHHKTVAWRDSQWIIIIPDDFIVMVIAIFSENA